MNILTNRLSSIALSVIALSLSLPDTASASANESDFETELALQIVNDYRQLRTSCNDQQGDARKMCYYRLRIGTWDYKEARKTLANKGIRVTADGTQVAKAH